MKDFKRRVEFRRLLEHETRMALPVKDCLPALCGKCLKPLPQRHKGQGRQKKWCDDCRKDIHRGLSREYKRRNRKLMEK